jgi:nitrogen PTS system EIIA component
MEPVDLCPVTTLLAKGGILYGVPGDDKTSALMATVERLRLPDGVDRDRVIEEILRREDISSTGIGQGMAIPHPQTSTALQLPESVLTLAFLEHPVDFGAPDGVPVQTLFTILSCDPGQHLRLLAHLGRTLQQAEVINALASQLPAAEILAVFGRVETALHDRYAAAAGR